MTMIDTVFLFDREEEARVELPQFYAEGSLNTSLCAPTKWYHGDHEEQKGYGLIVALETSRPDQWDKLGGADLYKKPHMAIQLDRDKSTPERAVILHSNLSDHELSVGHFEPVLAGSNYPKPLKPTERSR